MRRQKVWKGNKNRAPQQEVIQHWGYLSLVKQVNLDEFFQDDMGRKVENQELMNISKSGVQGRPEHTGKQIFVSQAQF